jgi:hypothetical protein
LTTTSIHEPTDLQNISLYPNPASHALYISTETRLRIQITDMTGRNVVSTELPFTHSIDLGALKSGIYLCRMMDMDGYSTTKTFVKN